MLSKIGDFCGDYKVANIKKTVGNEGHGFQCHVLKGGRVLGLASDYGDGGAINWSFESEVDLAELTTFAKTKCPQVKFEVAETFIGTVVDYFETVKKLKTKASKVIVCVEQDTKDVDEHGVPEGFIQFGKLSYTPENVSKVKAKYPNLIVLNDELIGFNLPKVKAKR